MKVGESTMEETVKALETKLAQLEAKVGKKSKSGVSTSPSSSGLQETFSFASNRKAFPLRPGKAGCPGYENSRALLL